jgi:hypothetical protein
MDDYGGVGGLFGNQLLTDAGDGCPITERIVSRTHKDRVQLAAGRCGLRLIKRRSGTTLTRDNAYWLRSLSDASQAVVLRPGGGLTLSKIPAYRLRDKAATWRTLDDVERVLKGWGGATSH